MLHYYDEREHYLIVEPQRVVVEAEFCIDFYVDYVRMGLNLLGFYRSYKIYSPIHIRVARGVAPPI